MSKIIIEIEVLRSGQPKDYADSVYEAIYTLSNEGCPAWTPDRDIVLKYVRAVYQDDFFLQFEVVGPRPYLKTLERIVDNQWRVVIVAPWTD